uniref:Protein kinase domain-containing protein n=1 Tax=Panagrolaimus davidi TaxID=227884 RepID=A0A914PUS7_9BILA
MTKQLVMNHAKHVRIQAFVAILTRGAFVGVAIFALFKRRCRKHTADDFKTLENGLIKPLKLFQQCEKKEGILEMIRDVQSFKTGKYIGGGSYSRGVLKNMPVAVKVALKNGRKSFYKELQIYDKVSHPNILEAKAVHFGIEDMLFLGLRKFSLKHYFSNFGKNLGIEQLKQYCIQIADGMKYLHSKNIIHCDLKIDNILIKDESGENVEISDFGCAIDLEHDHELKVNGTITHMAYELLKKSINANYSATASKATDVWSFAVTVWQIFHKSDKFPYNFIKVGDIVANYENGKKLPKPVLLPEIIWRYNLLRCFDLDPSSRPSMAELHKTLIKYHNAPIVSTI